MSRKIAVLLAAGVLALATSAGAVDINRYDDDITVTQSGTVSVSQADSSMRYMCYSVCAPAAETTARAIDHATGQYFEAVWTIIHDTNTDGQAVLYAIDGGSVTDSVSVRLVAGMTYGGDELVGDSIVVWVWDVDDTCYLFGRGTYPYRRDWQGD